MEGFQEVVLANILSVLLLIYVDIYMYMFSHTYLEDSY